MKKEDFTNNKAVGFLTNFLDQNSPTLAMIGSMGLLAAALIAAFKASQKVSEVKQEFDREIKDLSSKDQEMAVKSEKTKELKTSRNVKYILAYRWVLLFGISSVGMMFLCNYLNGAKIAGLTALAAWKQDEIKKMAENGKKLLGEEKFKELENKTLEELVQENFIGKDGGFALKPTECSGDFFVDTNQGILFQIDEKVLLDSLAKAREECQRNHGLSEVRLLENYYGVEAPKRAKHFWGPKREFNAHLGQREMFGCTMRTIEYDNSPTSAYDAGIPGYSK